MKNFLTPAKTKTSLKDCQIETEIILGTVHSTPMRSSNFVENLIQPYQLSAFQQYVSRLPAFQQGLQYYAFLQCCLP